jgi:hypothetical protein
LIEQLNQTLGSIGDCRHLRYSLDHERYTFDLFEKVMELLRRLLQPPECQDGLPHAHRGRVSDS